MSYYDYYRPEAYIPETDTYLPKDAAINEDIDRCDYLPFLLCYLGEMW